MQLVNQQKTKCGSLYLKTPQFYPSNRLLLYSHHHSNGFSQKQFSSDKKTIHSRHQCFGDQNLKNKTNSCGKRATSFQQGRKNQKISKTEIKMFDSSDKREKELLTTHWTEKIMECPTNKMEERRQRQKKHRSRSFCIEVKKTKIVCNTISHDEKKKKEEDKKQQPQYLNARRNPIKFKDCSDVELHYQNLIQTLENNREESMRQMREKKTISQQAYDFLGARLQRQNIRKRQMGIVI